MLVDEMGLGLCVDDRRRLLDAAGRPQPCLHYVGPMLKAQYWEAVAVPELRVRARSVAEQVVRALRVGTPA
ncbi:MAG TPA: hypothetical protein VFY73_15785 [Ideonella sp.]|uniref:hypothetical protein n=1 Tax=Ideonella sp. TaxID=1929293 RepID=UPI002E301ADE|nr:hypothetical protein [Ideonella sp.]HEX5685481.1 hypothetical protein [Ideonella sp.]